jgi:hypothetical protein
VLDWELSTLGHPLADLGYNCMIWHFGEGFGASEGYAGMDLEAFGIPSEKEYVAAYARRTGRRDIPDWDFYVAFSLFRLAAIVQGVYKRGLDGNASSETAKSYGDRARVLADLGWSLVKEEPDEDADPPRMDCQARAPSESVNVAGVARSDDYSSVSGTIDASLPLGSSRCR